MNRKLVEKKYKDKINLFQKYNKEYYIKNNSSISDSEFDILKKEILDLENKFIFLKVKTLLPNQLVLNHQKIF